MGGQASAERRDYCSHLTPFGTKCARIFTGYVLRRAGYGLIIARRAKENFLAQHMELRNEET